MPKIKIKELGNKEFFKCNQCSHVWAERKKARKYEDSPPALCPHCKSPFWDKDKR